MSGIDTSMYSQGGGSGTNAFMNIINLQKAATENRLVQQDYQGKQGVVDLWQNAPKDADGNPDPNYIIQNAGQAGIHAADAIQGAQAIQQQKIDIQRALLGQSQDQLELGKNVNDAIVSSSVPMLKDMTDDIKSGNYDPDAYRKRALDTATDVVNASVGADGKPNVTAQSVLSQLSKVPFENGPATLKLLTNRVAAAQAWDGHLTDALQIKRGQTGAATINGMTQPTTTSEVTGEVTPAGPVVPAGTTFQGGKTVYNSVNVPANNPFNYSNPSNPNSQQVPSNPGKPAAPGAPGTAVQGAPLSGQSTAANPADPSNPAGQSLPEAPPGYENTLDASLDRANSAIEHANAATQLAAPLKGVLQLADAGGPNAALAAKFKGAIADSPLGGLLDQTKDNVAKFEILNKFASDVAGMNMSANARNQIESAVQELSNPNASQFPKALRTVSKYLLARADAAKAYGNQMSSVVSDPNVTPSKVIGAEQDWRNNFDQNSFELPYMNDDEKKNLLGSMSPRDQQSFMSKTRHMVQNGHINPDDLQ